MLSRDRVSSNKKKKRFREYYANKALIEWKGSGYEYGRNLGLLRIINFARNKLRGEIPEGITSLLEVTAEFVKKQLGWSNARKDWSVELVAIA